MYLKHCEKDQKLSLLLDWSVQHLCALFGPAVNWTEPEWNSSVYYLCQMKMVNLHSAGWCYVILAFKNKFYCLEAKREYYQNCSVLGCVTQCSQSAAHSCEQFLQVQQIWFVTLGPLRLHRGGCLELYYCNMVEWSWWDLGFICKTN